MTKKKSKKKQSQKRVPQTPEQPILLTTAQAAAYLNIPARTLESWRVKGRYPGPPVARIGANVFYRRVDLEDWVAERVVRQGG
ncbi:MAG: helix-turn-helix domain-containing protein [Nocardioides sp.]|nr:helix-turn-helix domain-containing protein [Nocardioides sp.]